MSRPQPSAVASSSRPVIKLDQNILGRFKPAKVFKDAVDHDATNPSGEPYQIVSISFDDLGEKCVTAGEDESFVLWDAKQGRKSKTFYSKKYGIGLVRFTHRSGNILHTSTKGDHAIRYHSMHDNKYLSYFRGHENTVRSLHMSPADDAFVSSGDDATVRLWDLRTPVCRGLLRDIGGTAIAAFDNTGAVFAVACSQTQTIALYAHGTMDYAPFAYGAIVDHSLADISIPPPIPTITSLSFSNDGIYILLGTSSDYHYVMDAYSNPLVIVRRLTGHQGLSRSRDGTPAQGDGSRGKSGEEVCWSGDSKFVISGSNDGSICVWDLTAPEGEEKLTLPPAPHGGSQRIPTLEPIVRLQSGGVDGVASRCVRFNPRYGMLASGGEDLSFWLPEKDENALLEEGF